MPCFFSIEIEFVLFIIEIIVWDFGKGKWRLGMERGKDWGLVGGGGEIKLYLSLYFLSKYKFDFCPISKVASHKIIL